MPASALPLISPVSGKPVFLELLEQCGDDTSKHVVAGFRAYAHLLLCPVLRLFLHYGILVEAHPQNTFLVVDKAARFQGILLRDFGGIRIHEPTLKARGLKLRVHRDRLTVTNEWTSARRRLVHAVFQWHLGHLTWAISRAAGLDETILWQQVREVTINIFDSHRGDISKSRWNKEFKFLLESEWEAKSSFRMRLDDTQEEIFVPAPNLMSKNKLWGQSKVPE